MASFGEVSVASCAGFLPRPARRQFFDIQPNPKPMRCHPFGQTDDSGAVFAVVGEKNVETAILFAMWGGSCNGFCPPL